MVQACSNFYEAVLRGVTIGVTKNCCYSKQCPHIRRFQIEEIFFYSTIPHFPPIRSDFFVGKNTDGKSKHYYVVAGIHYKIHA
jgi:hypothetical protein